MRDNLLGVYAASLEETRTLCANIPEPGFRRILLGKSPAWLVGHLAVGSDFIADLCAAKGRLNDWMPLFAPGTQPAADNPAYPGKQALLDALGERHQAAIQAFAEATDAHLHSEPPMPEFRAYFPTIADAVVYLMASHEYYHNAQLRMWCLASKK